MDDFTFLAMGCLALGFGIVALRLSNEMSDQAPLTSTDRASYKKDYAYDRPLPDTRPNVWDLKRMTPSQLRKDGSMLDNYFRDRIPEDMGGFIKSN